MEVKDLYIVVDLYPELTKPLQEGLHKHLKNQFRRMPGQKWYSAVAYCISGTASLTLTSQSW